MFLLTQRQARAALAAAAGAATYLAASEIGARRIRVTGLFVLASVAMTGLAAQQASNKARAVDNRLSNFLSNGGFIGGNLKVSGETNTTTFKINGTSLTLNHSLGNPPGGGPLSYSPSYESSQSSYEQDIKTVLQAANIVA